MKRLLHFLVLLTLVLTSCATSVDVYYMQPSEIDMGMARNIAIASAVPYSGRLGGYEFIRFSNFSDNTWYFRSSSSDMYLRDRVANYATREFENTLYSTGYFNILDREVTDSILAAGRAGVNTNSMFKEKGVDAVIIPRILGMSVDEFIYRIDTTKTVLDPKTNTNVVMKEPKFYLSQIVSIDFEYSIISTKTEQLVATRRFSKTIYNEDVQIKYHSTYSSTFDLYSMFTTALDSFQSSIMKQLVPLGRRANITLMANKPKDESIQDAYELVKKGNVQSAKTLFLEHYNKTGFIPSGYNSALLSAATGDFDTAIDELKQMVTKTNDSEVLTLLERLQRIKKNNERAQSQIKGESAGFSVDGSVNIYNQVMGY